MGRRKRDYSRKVLADPKFGDQLVTKFINIMMLRGKKNLSEKMFYGALEIASERSKRPALQVLKEALENVRPVVEVRSRRVGGATYQVPTEVRPERRDSLAIRWLVSSSRVRSEKSMNERLANELVDAAQNRGAAVKKRDDTHRMAEANRAFAHYRW